MSCAFSILLFTAAMGLIGREANKIKTASKGSTSSSSSGGKGAGSAAVKAVVSPATPGLRSEKFNLKTLMAKTKTVVSTGDSATKKERVKHTEVFLTKIMSPERDEETGEYIMLAFTLTGIYGCKGFVLGREKCPDTNRYLAHPSRMYFKATVDTILNNTGLPDNERTASFVINANLKPVTLISALTSAPEGQEDFPDNQFQDAYNQIVEYFAHSRVDPESPGGSNIFRLKENEVKLKETDLNALMHLSAAIKFPFRVEEEQEVNDE